MSRESAINHQQSIIVKAPAGSGKTEMLVQRYLALLARDCKDPCQIVAITFTRKAAAEMLSRIRRELTLASEAPPDSPHKKITHKLAQEVLAKAKQYKWHTPSLVTEENVTTIDAFCHTLVSLDPLKAGFLTMPEIFTDSDLDKLYKEAASQAIQTMKDAVLDEVDKHKLMHLLYIHNNSPVKLRAGVAKILANRTAVLPLIQDNNYQPQKQLEQLCKELCTLLSNRASTSWLQQITAALDANRENFESGAYKPPPLDTDWTQTSLENWKALADAILTKSGSLRKQFREKAGFIKGSQTKEDIVSLIETLRDLCSGESLDAAADTSWNEWLMLLQECRNWRDKYTEDELLSAEAAQRIIKLAAAHLAQIFKQENKCDHTEIMLAAIEVMGQEEAPSLLAERLGHRLKHLLVDEFQDTSVGQLNLLEAITSSWDESSNNTLFLVGDPMQSIYAFRQADVRIFNRLWEEQKLGQIPLARLTLKENYRSNEPIVDWLNKNFENIFPHQANNLINSVAYTQAKAMTAKGESLAPTHLAVKHNEEVQPTYEQIFSPVIDKIKEIMEQDPDATIGILARKRSDATGVLSLLQQDNIEFDADKFSSMEDNPLIIDLMSLTRAIYNTEDEIAWYACLRAPWCGLKLQDIVALSRINRDADNQQKSLWSLVLDLAGNSHQESHQKSKEESKEALKVSLSEDGIQRIKHFVAGISLAMGTRRRTNWHNVMDKAWQGLGGNHFATTPKDLADLDLFMDNLRQCSTDDKLDLEEMDKRMKLHGVAFSGNSRIRILTIHHSKGLEFDYVFLVNMNKRGGNSSGDGLLEVTDFIMNDSGRAGAVISVNAPGYTVEDKPVHIMLKGIKKTQQDQELRRLLYVACSRARRGLFLHYLVSYKNDEDGEGSSDGKSHELKATHNSFLKLLEPEKLDEEVHPIQEIRRASRASSQQNKQNENIISNGEGIPTRRIRQEDLNDFIQSAIGDANTQPFPDWHSPYERVRGIAIHRVMEILAAATSESIKQLAAGKGKQELFESIAAETKQLITQQGLDTQQADKVLDDVSETIDFCLQDERALWIMHSDGMNECEFISKNAPMVRIDRTFVDAGTRWIVDYKTSEKGDFSDAELDKFHRQLHRYGKTFETFQEISQKRSQASNGSAEKLPIKLGIYCPQNGFWKEWEYQDTAPLTGDYAGSDYADGEYLDTEAVIKS